jgi:hypothetical protein
MEKQKLPYELLVRWDEAGKLKGAHVQFRTIYRDGDEIISDKIEHAEPIAVAGNKGFPISDVLGDVEAAALASVNQATADAEATVAAVNEAAAKHVQEENSRCDALVRAAVSERDAATSEATALRAQLTETRRALDAATASPVEV